MLEKVMICSIVRKKQADDDDFLTAALWRDNKKTKAKFQFLVGEESAKFEVVWLSIDTQAR